MEALNISNRTILTILTCAGLHGEDDDESQIQTTIRDLRLLFGISFERFIPPMDVDVANFQAQMALRFFFCTREWGVSYIDMA